MALNYHSIYDVFDYNDDPQTDIINFFDKFMPGYNTRYEIQFFEYDQFTYLKISQQNYFYDVKTISSSSAIKTNFGSKNWTPNQSPIFHLKVRKDFGAALKSIVIFGTIKSAKIKTQPGW